MKKIIDYKVVEATGAVDAIVREVKFLFGMGWQPLGGVCVSNHTFYQAMVKYED